MPVFLQILLSVMLLQGCTLDLRESPQPTPAEPTGSRAQDDRRRQAQQYLARALEYERQQDFLNAAQARFSYHKYLDDSVASKVNTAKIWENLNRADKQALRRRYQTAPGALSGWVELAFIRRTLLTDLKTLERALRAWQQNYPAHPANFTIVGQLRETALRINTRPQQIALLLPLRGVLREAAAAVRDGFMTAWYHSGHYQPLLRVYEANSLNIDQAYAQALTEGADFIVGPLEKQALTRLAAANRLTAPTLALNRIEVVPEAARRTPDALLPTLMQFSLSPEDEARQAAARAYTDGYDRALVIVPDDSWGQRLAGAFRDSWTAAGAVILETVNYDPRNNDYAGPVKQALNIDASEVRIQTLRRVLGRSLESRPRWRQDADVVFMAAFPADARQIVPQLRFYQAGRLPVYATSHIFTGNVNPQADADMEGVIFPDLPWVLAADTQTQALRAQVNDNFQAAASAYLRLYALGTDAFNLIPQLARLAYEDEASFSGATGRLSMSADGVITRTLPWGKIVNGRPELSGGS